MWILRAIWNFFLDALETVVISLAIFVIVYQFLFQPHQIDGRSMVPTFHNGDYILTDKISYRFHPPKRGDIIVFRAPQDERVEFVKRIIAVPGDKVMVKNKKVYLNGKPLDEPYTNDRITPSDVFLREGREVIVPEGNYIVMGDNRLHSSDSRHWGFVTKDEIVGRVFFRYWPPEKFGVIKTSEIDPTIEAVKGIMTN